MVTGLARSFYDHLYRWGERAPAGARLAPRPLIRLADGCAFQPPASASSGSFAVLDTLAPSLTDEQLQRLLDPDAPGGFHATWARLFPATDPLDTSISITPEGLPPPDLLQFPFPVGQKWWFNGAHNWNGSGVTYGKPYSSMDFFTSANSCSAPPAGDWAVAAAGGIGSHPGGALCWYRIDHGGGWITSYYHLRNVVPNGPVTANGIIGTLGCETCVGGSASGPHVHFSLLYNGAYTDLEGLVLSGWTVHSGSGDYSTGLLEREGVQLKPYSSVLNEGVRPRTPTPSPTATFTPTSTPTATSTSTPTPTSDLTPLPVATFASTAGPIRLYLPMLIS